jgi:hypothetical protein
MTHPSAQEYKEIATRTAKDKPWGVQPGHLYMRPYQRHFDDSLELIWARPPYKWQKQKKVVVREKQVDLIIRRRKSVWSPVENEVEYGTFYA